MVHSKELEAELHGLALLIRDHVMYQEEYKLKRELFQEQLLILIRQTLGLTLDSRIPMEIEILLQDSSVHGLRRILTQAHRDLLAAVRLHPDNKALQAEEIRWTEVLDKLKK